jgi:hypothetical protein
MDAVKHILTINGSALPGAIASTGLPLRQIRASIATPIEPALDHHIDRRICTYGSSYRALSGFVSLSEEMLR